MFERQVGCTPLAAFLTLAFLTLAYVVGYRLLHL